MQPNSNAYFGSSTPTNYAPQKRGLSRRTLLLLVGGVIVLLVMALGVLSATSSTKGTTGSSEKMLTLMQQGNGVESYALLSEQGKGAVSEELWVAQVVALKSKIADKKFEKFYTKKLDETSSEIAYNVGDPGSIYQVRFVVNNDSGLIESLSHNPTTF